MSTINAICIDAFIGEFFSRPEKYERVLDLGCGDQPYAHHYSSRTDFSIPADYTVRSRIAVQLSAMALPFRDQSIDVVLFSEVLEHLVDPQLALMEVGRVLKPGGKLLLTTPFMYMMHEIPHDHSRFTLFGLEHLLMRAGMEIRQVQQRGSAVSLAVALMEFLVCGASEAVSRIPIVGLLWRPISRVLGVCWTHAMRLAYGRPRKVSPARLDAAFRFKGAYGQMRLWTLGYCVEAQKPAT